MITGMLMLAATLAVVGFLLYGVYRESAKECRSASWAHRGAA
jgi:A13L protein